MIVRLLTELDALLDTRHGVIDNLDTQAAARLITNPAYYTRLIDHMEPLCGIPEASYQEAWQHRNANDLSHSSVTPLAEFLHCQVMTLESKQGMDPTLEGIELVVNLYPYQLTAAEERAVGLAILSMIGHKTPVRFVFLSPSELTPAMVRKEYAVLALYNHHAWLRAHEAYMVTHGMPRVTLVAPKLCFEEVPAPEKQSLEIKGGKVDMWHAMEVLGAEVIGLSFMDVMFFSTALGQALLEPRQTASEPVQG